MIRSTAELGHHLRSLTCVLQVRLLLLLLLWGLVDWNSSRYGGAWRCRSRALAIVRVIRWTLLLKKLLLLELLVVMLLWVLLLGGGWWCTRAIVWAFVTLLLLLLLLWWLL